MVAAHGTSLDLGRIEKAPELDIRDSPDPFPHWTLRECLEQPEALARALGFGGRLSEDRVYLGGLDRQRERMAKISTMILAGCGTSLNASIYGAKLMREYEAFDTAMSMDAAEIRPADIPSRHAGMLAVSQSGEVSHGRATLTTTTQPPASTTRPTSPTPPPHTHARSRAIALPAREDEGRAPRGRGGRVDGPSLHLGGERGRLAHRAHDQARCVLQRGP